MKSIDTKKITNPIAKSAFEAWQNGDQQKWISLFTKDAILLDDGSKRDFRKFSTHAIGHEWFLTIDKVEDDGKSIYGHFHSDAWGNFKTYFKFRINVENKVFQLEIGKANY